MRRFFRIYPAYLVAMTLFALCFTHGVRDFWYQFIRHALLIHNFNPGTVLALNGSFWSIAVEIQLYLVYPLLLALVAKFGWPRTLICLAGCEIFFQTWDFWSYQILSYGDYYSPFIFYKVTPVVNQFGAFLDHYLKGSPLGFWCSWAIGACAADAFLKGRPMPLAKFSVWFCVFLVVAAYFAELLAPLFSLLSAILTAKIIGNYLSGRLPNIRVPDFWLIQLRRIGLWSYSIYLFHEPLIKMFSGLLLRIFPGMNPLFTFFCCLSFLLVVVPLTGISYYCIERPGIALGKRLIKKMAEKKISPTLPQKIQSVEEPAPGPQSE